MTGIRSFIRKWHNTVIPLTDDNTYNILPHQYDWTSSVKAIKHITHINIIMITVKERKYTFVCEMTWWAYVQTLSMLICDLMVMVKGRSFISSYRRQWYSFAMSDDRVWGVFIMGMVVHNTPLPGRGHFTIFSAWESSTWWKMDRISMIKFKEL